MPHPLHDKNALARRNLAAYITLMTPTRRRTFLKRATVFAAGAALPKWWIEQSAYAADAPTSKSPNDQPTIALIGCGGRGRGVAGEASKFGRVTAVCDVDE